MKKIKKHFDDIIILDILSSYKELKSTSNVNMILTNYTISDYQTNIPILKVSTLINDEDLRNIRNLADQLKLAKNYSEITNTVSKYFDKNLFYYNLDIPDKTATLDLLCNDLKNLGYVNDKFKEEIYAHEEIASSGYRNVAIPHPFSNEAKKSTISVVIFKNPILWDNNKVFFVFMISLKKEDNSQLRDIFQLLFELISNEKTMQQLIHCRDFASFITLLSDHYSLK